MIKVIGIIVSLTIVLGLLYAQIKMVNECKREDRKRGRR